MLRPVSSGRWIAAAIVAIAIAAAIAILAITALGGATSTTASSAGAAGAPAVMAPPAAMGQTQAVDGLVAVTVYAYRQPVAGAQAPAGEEWAAADVRLCVTSMIIEVTRAPWTLVTDAGQEIPASWQHVGVAPEYPRQPTVVAGGQCVRGWVPYAIPAGSRPVRVEYLAAVVPAPPPLAWAI